MGEPSDGGFYGQSWRSVVSGAHVGRCLAGDLKLSGSRRLVTGTWRSPRQQQSPVETATGTCWADIPLVLTGKAR